MLKALSGFAIFALLGLSSHTPVWTQASQPMVTLDVAPPSVLAGAARGRLPNVPPDAIRKISCNGGWGTGVVVADDTVMTTNHVVASQTGCHDDETNEPFVVAYRNASQDFAILKVSTNRYKTKLRVSCSGFVTGATYYAYGYAGMGPGDLAMFRLRATDQIAPPGSVDARFGTVFDGTRMLTGTVIPGMSGGPVLDTHGRVVGVNNATGNNFTLALSRAVHDTVFCLDYRDLTR